MSSEGTARRWPWLIVAIGLLALSAWLMSRGDRERPTARAATVRFPRGPKLEELERNARRRTLPPVAPPNDDDESPPRIKRDPLHVALPPDSTRSALVFEVDALKESGAGKAWLDCMLARNDGDRRGLARLREQYGIDPVEDIERVAVSSAGVAVLQGSFEGVRFDGEGWTTRTYGESGTIYRTDESGGAVARWGSDLFIVARDVEALEDAIDRLESTDPAQTSILNAEASYGDIYGVLSPEDLAELVPSDQPDLVDRIASVVERVDVHVVASDDVAFVADVTGPHGEQLNDLAKSMGTALALGRAKAQSDGDDELAALLDDAKVKPGQGQFAVDVALPMELVKAIGPCRKR